MTVTNEGVRSILVQIVAQNRLIRSGLRLLVESGPDMIVVSEAPSVRDACGPQTTAFPDVIVVDLENESAAGLLELQAGRSSIRIIGLLGNENVERPAVIPYCVSALVYTQSAEESLIPAIQAVYHDRRFEVPSAATRPIITRP